MTPAEYEELVKQLLEELSKSFKDLNGRFTYGAKNRLLGTSEYKHQIDVSFENDRWLILIECKRWNRLIGVEEMLVLASRRVDIEAANPHRHTWLSIASREGATRSAMTLAKHFRISIDTVRSTKEYAMRLRSRINVGATDALSLGDSFRLEVTRG